MDKLRRQWKRQVYDCRSPRTNVALLCSIFVYGDCFKLSAQSYKIIIMKSKAVLKVRGRLYPIPIGVLCVARWKYETALKRTPYEYPVHSCNRLVLYYYLA